MQPVTHADASRKAPRVLVTGGAGFIGSHLVDALLEQGCDVTVIDDLSTGKRSNLPAHHERLRFIEADLTHALEAFGPGERFEQIYHLAAAVGVRLVVQKPAQSIETNVNQAAALLRFALNRSQDGSPVPTLIASSSEVYGKGIRTPFSEDDDVLYGPTTVSRWSYACSKAIDEYLALAHHHEDGLGVVVARFFNTIGPRQIGRYGMVVPRFVESALAGKDLEVHGDGEQSRCFCHVADIVDVLPKLLGNKACHGRVFNLGSAKSVTIIELARRVIEQTQSSAGIRRVEYEEVFGPGFEDLRRREPDLSRVCNATGWKPLRTLDESIRDIAAWMREGNRE